MNKRVIARVLVPLLFGAAFITLGACGGADASGSKVVSPSYELEFLELAEGEVEIRELTNAPQGGASNLTHYVDFENENMALIAPLSMILDAQENDSDIALRHVYSGGNEGDCISFSLPAITEYEIYFPDASVDDISVLVADVVVAEEGSTRARAELKELGCTVSSGEPVYCTMIYLINNAGDTPVAIKLDSFEEALVMREEKALNEDELNRRLYLSSAGDAYKPLTTAYYQSNTADRGYVDTYFYGSFISVQGETAQMHYGDLAGHYAENAITQVQLSRNLANALSTEERFNPDAPVSAEEVLEAQGSFYAQPLMSKEAYELAAAGIVKRYGVDQMFSSLIDPDSADLAAGYVARVPYATAEVYEAIGLAGGLDALVDEGLALNSRISAAILAIGGFIDNAEEFDITGLLAAEPTSQQVDDWLTGINDVSEDNPLRPYAALAVAYGLLTPNEEGSLALYEPITRADLCLLYAALDSLYAEGTLTVIRRGSVLCLI